jgi:hypothetical protein
VDAGLAEGSKPPATFIRAKMVFVCSPDTRHFGQLNKSAEQNFYVPVWLREAMEAACPYMLSKELDLQTVQQRMNVVGPKPRSVYCSEQSYQIDKSKIDKAMRNEPKRVANVLMHGAGGIEADHDSEKPLSAVFSFDVVPGSNYQERTVRFVSDYARQQLGMATLKSIYNSIISNTNPHRNTELGRTFELVVYRLLQNGWHTQMTRLTGDDQQHDAVDLTVKKGDSNSVQMVPAGDGLWKRAFILMNKMLSAENSSKPIFIGGNFPVIDAADARNRGFSITIARTKGIKVSTVEMLRSKLGLKKTEVLQIVFLVPEGYDAPTGIPFEVDGVEWYKAELPSPLTNSEIWEEALKFQP